MELNANLMTVLIPSSFGMPACGGHAFATTTATGAMSAAATGAFGTSGAFATTSVVPERQAVKGDMGLAIAYVPGTSAWRPPSS